VAIATTEVGLPAALNPGKRIVDLAGLNSAEVVREGIGVTTMLRGSPPDVVYLPHPDYAELAGEFATDPEFLSRYEVYSAEQVKCLFGIALLRSSPWYEQLRSIAARQMSSQRMSQKSQTSVCGYKVRVRIYTNRLYFRISQIRTRTLYSNFRADSTC
jgi:hypothetical protein